MAGFTLVAFRFVHDHAFSVDLFGSWDNFTTPISLKRDKRRSRDEWTVCPAFQPTSIVVNDSVNQSRLEHLQGGLQQGETYWYYYRIDGDEECCDPTEPTTNMCGMLPGQNVNVLYVPHDIDTQARSTPVSNTSGFYPWTLDPTTRFKNPQPASSMSQHNDDRRLFSARTCHSSRRTSYRAWSSVSWARPLTSWLSQNLQHRRVKSASAVDDRPLTAMSSSITPTRAISLSTSEAINPAHVEFEFSAMQLGPDGMSLIRRVPLTYSTESINTIVEEDVEAQAKHSSHERMLEHEQLPRLSEEASEGDQQSVCATGLHILSPTESSSMEDYFGFGSPSFASTVPSTCGILTPRRLSDAAHYFEPMTFSLPSEEPKLEMKMSRNGPTPMERFLDEFDYLGSVVF